MDASRFKSVAINIDHYRKLKELSDKRFELPISLSKTTEFLIEKSHDELKASLKKDKEEKDKNGKSAR